jgi:hypothetical protein
MDPNAGFLEQIKAKSEGQWSVVPAFGASEDEEAAAVAAALDRDVPGWRG